MESKLFKVKMLHKAGLTSDACLVKKSLPRK